MGKLGRGVVAAVVIAALAVPAGTASAGDLRGVDPLPPVPSQHPAGPATGTSPWVSLVNQPPFSPGAMLLLTNGTVLVQSQGPENNGSNLWYRLIPDATGSYTDGTWHQLASLPTTYAPLYYASAVLPSGDVIIEGGEYNHGNLVWTNQGAIYNPVNNTWTTVAHPTGSEWTRIGDAPSAVLANGTFMVGASGFSGTTAEARLDAATLTWAATGTGKADGNGEEGWSLLPNGDVLTVDTTDTDPAQNTEIYNPNTGAWTSAGTTPVNLVDADGEVGPQVLRPNGTVLATGATGAMAIYTVATGKWSAGPSLPVIGGKQYDIADGPAAVLPDGNVLLEASPGDYNPPAHYFVFNGTSLVRVPDAPGSANEASNYGYMMMLPTGQVLFNNRLGDMMVYTAGGTPKVAWAPVVTSVATTLAAGRTYVLSGKRLNGLTQDSAFGDDYQGATNYPLVRITNTASGNVVYARTYGMTSMAVMANLASSIHFTVPATIGTGPSTLAVEANGIPSTPVNVTVTAAS